MKNKCRKEATMASRNSNKMKKTKASRNCFNCKHRYNCKILKESTVFDLYKLKDLCGKFEFSAVYKSS